MITDIQAIPISLLTKWTNMKKSQMCKGVKSALEDALQASHFYINSGMKSVVFNVIEQGLGNLVPSGRVPLFYKGDICCLVRLSCIGPNRPVSTFQHRLDPPKFAKSWKGGGRGRSRVLPTRYGRSVNNLCWHWSVDRMLAPIQWGWGNHQKAPNRKKRLFEGSFVAVAHHAQLLRQVHT